MSGKAAARTGDLLITGVFSALRLVRNQAIWRVFLEALHASMRKRKHQGSEPGPPGGGNGVVRVGWVLA